MTPLPYKERYPPISLFAAIASTNGELRNLVYVYGW